jgi:hypothetical protein
MKLASRILGYLAFAVMTVYAVLAGGFILGETFIDTGALTGVGVSLLWAVPLVGLSVLAARRPDTAAEVLVVLTGLVAVFALANAVLGLVPGDVGPVAAIMVFTLGVALGFLGLHRALPAGLLMLAAVAAQLAATVLAHAMHGIGVGPGPGAMLTTSSRSVVLPLVAVGLLYLLAAAVGREPLHPGPLHGVRLRVH